MNKDARAEESTLRSHAPHDAVTAVDHVNTHGLFTDSTGQHDLTKESGVQAFIATLDASPEQRKAVARVLDSVGGGGGRDEVRQVVTAYAQSDRSGSGMHRMVLSGHSDADNLSGDNGDVPFAVFEQLGKIFPRAAAQVDHLMLSSCYTGGATSLATPDAKQKEDPDAAVNYHRLFPNLKTILAYSGSSPSIATGSTQHMQRWEKQTQGQNVQTMPVDLEDGLRYGENVSTWDKAGGLHVQSDGEEDGASSLMSIIRRDDGMVAAYIAGNKECADPHSGELKTHYDYLMKALGNASVSAADHAFCEQQKAMVLRLRYYREVKRHFEDAYGGELNAAYGAANRSAPNFAAISRKQSLGEIDAFVGAQHGATNPAIKRGVELLTALKNLTGSILPLSWVT